MDQELIKDYKKELFENISGELTEEGKVSTFVQIVGEKEGMDKPVIVHVVTEFANDEEKEFFVKEAIPDICKRLRKNKIIPSFVVFVSECWITVMSKKTDEKKKSEIVLVNISSENGDEIEVYDIVRHPYEINEKGDLVSKVELLINNDITTTDSSDTDKKMEGRFTNLYGKFMKHLNND